MSPRSFQILVLAYSVFFIPSFSQIAEKEETVTGRIAFEGARSVDEKALREKMRTKPGRPFDEFMLRQDMKRIEALYGEKGFLLARIIQHKLSWDPDTRRVDVALTIEEGRQTRVRAVEVRGNESISRSHLLKAIALRPGHPLDEEVIAISELSILSLYARSGRIYAEVTVSNERTDDPLKVDAVFHIKEGSLVRVGKVAVEGRTRVRPRIVEREITMKRGEVYNPEKTYESQRRIYGTGLFKDVKLELEGVEEKREVVNVAFLVVEERPRWFLVGGGYESPDKMKLNGEWGHNNLFNNGQRLTIQSSYSFNLKGEHREEFDARHLEPYFISSPFKLLLHPFYYRERGHSYLTEETGASANIGRYLGRDVHGSFQAKYKVARVDTLGQEGLPELEATTNSLTLSLTRDTREPYFDPKRGSFNLFSLERAGGVLGGSNSFNRFIADWSFFLRVRRSATVAVRLKEGYTTTFGRTTPDKVSSDERFELGGANSLRGYEEASIGPIDPFTQKQSGIIMTNVNLEFRFSLPLVKNLDAGYFLDSGGMWLKRKEVRIEDLRWGAGLGLRWIIPYLGPLRFDWAWKLTPKEQEERWKWYLAFGHAF